MLKLALFAAMASPAYLVPTARLLLMGGAIGMALIINAPAPALIGLALIAASVLGAEKDGRIKRTAEWGALAGTALIVAYAVAGKGSIFTFNTYYAIQAWLVAAALTPRPRLSNRPDLTLSKTLAVGWLFAGAAAMTGDGYVNNSVPTFYTGLAAVLAGIICAKRFFRLPVAVIQVLNTAILLVVGLPIVDTLLFRSSSIDRHPDALQRYYSYDVTKHDPEAFGQWALYFRREFRKFEEACVIREPGKIPPFHLRPNSRVHVFQCDIGINSLGFRGPEIPADKGNAYRIVVIGESTTFGITLTQDHYPWPQLLGELIRQRLKLDRPIEVINAGVPGATLEDNIARFPAQILPLKPDMIICYHGYNNFPLLFPALPSPRGKPAPEFSPRPANLLARLEYSRRLRAYERNRMKKLTSDPAPLSDVMAGCLAGQYRTLIDIARTNHLRLVIGDFSMAVNGGSAQAVVEFYRQGWPLVRTELRANEAHSTLVRKLCEQEPWITFVDTHPNLNGAYDKFIDLVHFDKPGERQMAETFYTAIQPLLEMDLSASGKRTRAQGTSTE